MGWKRFPKNGSCRNDRSQRRRFDLAFIGEMTFIGERTRGNGLEKISKNDRSQGVKGLEMGWKLQE